MGKIRKGKRKAARTSWRPAPLPGSAQASALAQVGARDRSRLDWLLNLLNRSSESIAQPSPAEVHNFESEAAIFCEPIGSLITSRSSMLTASQIADLIQEVQGVLSAILQGATHDFEISGVTLALIPNSRSRYMGSPAAIFRLAVAKLLETDGHRIRRCARPGCGKVFIRRKQALYCSRRCSQVEQFARYVRRHSS
jgi:hypothetical protein